MLSNLQQPASMQASSSERMPDTSSQPLSILHAMLNYHFGVNRYFGIFVFQELPLQGLLIIQ